MNQPYVYAILVDGVIRYIGKGRKKRFSDHLKVAISINEKRSGGKKVRALHFHNKLAKALLEGANVTHQVLEYFSTDEEAFAEEICQISSLEGLWNVADGGKGQTSGMMKKIWQRHEYIKQQMTNLQNMKAKSNTPEQRKKVSTIIIERNKSKDGRQATIDSNKKRWADPEYKARVTASMSAAQKKAWAPGGARRMGVGE
jgi:hypothetical protein